MVLLNTIVVDQRLSNLKDTHIIFINVLFVCPTTLLLPQSSFKHLPYDSPLFMFTITPQNGCHSRMKIYFSVKKPLEYNVF